MNTTNDPRTAEEIEEDAREWAADLEYLHGKSLWDVLWEESEEAASYADEVQQAAEEAARAYYGY